MRNNVALYLTALQPQPPLFFLVAEGVDAKTAAPAKAEEPKKEEKKQAEAPKEEAEKEAEAPKEEEAKKKESAALDSHSEIGE